MVSQATTPQVFTISPSDESTSLEKNAIPDPPSGDTWAEYFRSLSDPLPPPVQEEGEMRPLPEDDESRPTEYVVWHGRGEVVYHVASRVCRLVNELLSTHPAVNVPYLFRKADDYGVGIGSIDRRGFLRVDSGEVVAQCVNEAEPATFLKIEQELEGYGISVSDGVATRVVATVESLS